MLHSIKDINQERLKPVIQTRSKTKGTTKIMVKKSQKQPYRRPVEQEVRLEQEKHSTRRDVEENLIYGSCDV